MDGNDVSLDFSEALVKQNYDKAYTTLLHRYNLIVFSILYYGYPWLCSRVFHLRIIFPGLFESFPR